MKTASGLLNFTAVVVSAMGLAIPGSAQPIVTLLFQSPQALAY
jgi:hypothetical protein